MEFVGKEEWFLLALIALLTHWGAGEGLVSLPGIKGIGLSQTVKAS